MNMQILQAVLMEAQAKEAKAVVNLNNYMNNAVGIGEHPDIVSECSKLVKDIQEARDTIDCVNELVKDFVNKEKASDD